MCAHNAMRLYPTSFIPMLREFLKGFDNPNNPKLWNYYLNTQEGAPAV